MAKFVCDIEQVTSAGEKIVDASENMAKSTSTYSTNINQYLSSWKGECKTELDSTNNDNTRAIASKITRMDEFGEYIKEVAKTIQELEDELAAIKI